MGRYLTKQQSRTLSTNRALATALSAFTHPTLWAAILLLLFNDHYLKYAYPSWLTGKLSDFAGLFFFPFVLAAGL